MVLTNLISSNHNHPKLVLLNLANKQTKLI
uniref:Uncharacterized protein n=1 Tax=Setaria italica TaxID=4555 RepID=K4A3I9_SETIT